MSQFAAMAADTTQPYRVEIRDPRTDQVIRDHNGNPCYVDVLSTASKQGREIEKRKRRDLTKRLVRSRSGNIEPDDQVEANMELLAHLTVRWHLVSPFTGDVIEVACNPENAMALYSDTGMEYAYTQVWFAANSLANFMPPSSPTSSNSQDGSSPTSGA